MCAWYQNMREYTLSVRRVDMMGENMEMGCSLVVQLGGQKRSCCISNACSWVMGDERNYTNYIRSTKKSPLSLSNENIFTSCD